MEFLVPSSFALNPCLLDDRAPHRSLGRKPRGQLCRSRNNHGGADSVISLSDKWVLQRRNRVRDELADDLARRLGLDIQPPPGRDVEARNGFSDGRYVGRGRGTLRRGYGNAANGLALMLRKDTRQVAEHGIDTAWDEIVHGKRGA